MGEHTNLALGTVLGKVESDFFPYLCHISQYFEVPDNQHIAKEVPFLFPLNME